MHFWYKLAFFEPKNGIHFGIELQIFNTPYTCTSSFWSSQVDFVWNICKHIHFIFIFWCKRSMQSVTNIQMGIHSSQRPNIMYFIICKRHPVFPSLQSTYLMNFSAIRQCSLFPLFQIIRNAKLVVAWRKPVSQLYHFKNLRGSILIKSRTKLDLNVRYLHDYSATPSWKSRVADG